MPLPTSAAGTVDHLPDPHCLKFYPALPYVYHFPASVYHFTRPPIIQYQNDSLQQFHLGKNYGSHVERSTLAVSSHFPKCCQYRTGPKVTLVRVS